VESRLDAFKRFEAAGQELVAEGHFMAAEILEKISSLTSRREKLLDSWHLRDELYKQHLDYLAWAKETDSVVSWIASREPTIRDANLGESIEEVEELLRRLNDFDGAVAAQEAKLAAVNRITLIEQNFAALREREAAARAEEAKQKEQERLEAIKKKELARINNERRRENERRRTQEIKFSREDFDQMRANNAAAQHQMMLNGKSASSATETASSGSGATTSPTVEESNNFFARPRGESMRLEPKKARGRTPSFTTRRRTQSFRRHAATKNLNGLQNLPPVEVDGYLERKQELQSGGKRATVRYQAFFSSQFIFVWQIS
jgi:spectrin beta